MKMQSSGWRYRYGEREGWRGGEMKVKEEEGKRNKIKKAAWEVADGGGWMNVR
jgi:hypothetical protein